MRKLTEAEFKATAVPHPSAVAADAAPPFDFWPYFDAIPEEDFDNHDFSAGSVTYAWDMPGTPYQHVLVDAETPNVHLALVLNLDDNSVVGHHVLDLNKTYGLT